MHALNPYELLGVTIDNTPQQVRKAYYNLALLMHPDRGGSDKDMIVLKYAYDYVMEQVEGVNRDISFEDMEEAFKQFCLDQKEAETTFEPLRDIHDAANERFNAEWERRLSQPSQLWRASCAGGYENEMVPSNIQPDEYEDIECGSLVTELPTELIIYKEPGVVVSRPEGAPQMPDALVEPMQNYTTAVEHGARMLVMSDYRDAFILKECAKGPQRKTLEELVAEREKMFE